MDEEAFLDMDGALCVRLKKYRRACGIWFSSLFLQFSSLRLLNGNLGWSFSFLFFKGDCENAIF